MSMHMYMYMYMHVVHRCIVLLVQAKFLCAVVCVTLLDRLQGDQVIGSASKHRRVSTLVLFISAVVISTVCVNMWLLQSAL